MLVAGSVTILRAKLASSYYRISAARLEPLQERSCDFPGKDLQWLWGSPCSRGSLGCGNTWERVSQCAPTDELRWAEILFSAGICLGVLALRAGFLLTGAGLWPVPPWLRTARGCPERAALAGRLPPARWPWERPTGTL